jgi:hypothetical protein
MHSVGLVGGHVVLNVAAWFFQDRGAIYSQGAATPMGGATLIAFNAHSPGPVGVF